jgi:DNA invertase Pin-like site-specific DNA recombinase
VQEQELVEYAERRNWIVQKVYCDKGVTGATEKRPALDALLDDCHRRKIDVVLVWKFDRFARSLKQLLNALELFRGLGIGFVSCTEAIDTSLPHGEMIFQIIGAIAQWERSLIAERVRAGLQNARRQGKRLGRPPKAATKAGLKNSRMYDLRSTFASRANGCKASGLTVAHLLGHSSTQILPTYVKPLDENTRVLIEALDSARSSHKNLQKSVN